MKDCITEYIALSKKVFGNPRWCARSPKYDERVLETEVKKVLKKQLGNEGENAVLEDTRLDACKVFVVATIKATGNPRLLRSYSYRDTRATTCTIVEAIRATSAAPTYFKSKTFGTPPTKYQDGGMGHNNPSQLAANEFQNEDGLHQKMGILVNLGTGTGPATKGGGRWYKALPYGGHYAAAKDAIKIATDCENKYRFLNFSGRIIDGNCFRFSASNVGKIELDDLCSVEHMNAETMRYLDDVRVANAMKMCCKALHRLKGERLD